VLLKGMGEMFLAALQIAARWWSCCSSPTWPFGLLNRVAPALNAFQLGFPAKIFLVLVLSGIAITTLPPVIESLVDRSVTAVLN
jgi:flagellar biosynthetic protein FliR